MTTVLTATRSADRPESRPSQFPPFPSTRATRRSASASNAAPMPFPWEPAAIASRPSSAAGTRG